ncbi:MAG: 16S rRNA (guanine(527)-N(7))-methyltransferase RsmG [Halieaceae bacterium]|nr:16S rRNA (guanine(527)-N(7))-methyltransferase RsmG [Halieaceae bacterium]
MAASAQMQAQLLEYLALLQHWNRAYNLTAVREPVSMVQRHLLDSAAIVPFLPAGANRGIDVGTGAGLPGVPLAILRPDLYLDLLDSNSKKTRFLFQVKTALGLDNMTILHSRAERLRPGRPYDLVLSRAFASLGEMSKTCYHLCVQGGHFLAMKGGVTEQELNAIDSRTRLESVHALAVPGLDEQRHLVVLSRVEKQELV